MIIAPEKRKEIQKILEEFIKKRPSSVRLADIKVVLFADEREALHSVNSACYLLSLYTP